MSDTVWLCVKLHSKPIISMDIKIFRSTPLCFFCHLVFLVMCSGPVVTLSHMSYCLCRLLFAVSLFSIKRKCDTKIIVLV